MVGLTKKEKEALALFKQRVLEAFPDQVDSIQLFGSKARGDAAKFSDIDVLIRLAQDRADLATRSRVYRIASDVLFDREIDISPKILGRQDYERLRGWGEPLLLNIEQEGIVL